MRKSAKPNLEFMAKLVEHNVGAYRRPCRHYKKRPIKAPAEIDGLHGHWAPLSPFFTCPVAVNGQDFRSLEHALQVARMDPSDPGYKLHLVQIASQPSGYRARDIGLKFPPRPDWESIRKDVCRKLLIQKFSRHAVCLERLAQSGNAVITVRYGSGRIHFHKCLRHSDSLYWFRSGDHGMNVFGELLMELRAVLCQDTSSSPSASLSYSPPTDSTVTVAPKSLFSTPARKKTGGASAGTPPTAREIASSSKPSHGRAKPKRSAR